jgi:glutathionyl-hydroquinone reductase
MGWDGDALAGQMEDALERQQAAAEARQRRNNSSPAERARDAELESLRLSKARIQDQLSRATNPAHRAMLERALKSLEEQAGE